MTFLKTLLVLSTLTLSASALAAPTGLFVRDGSMTVSVQGLINGGSDIQAEYGFENFCYKGDAHATIIQINRLKAAGNFFSGSGGGHELKKVTLIRGIVSYDIALKFEDEVVPGEFETVHVKPCSLKI